jgi:hypothetical protein
VLGYTLPIGAYQASRQCTKVATWGLTGMAIGAVGSRLRGRDHRILRCEVQRGRVGRRRSGRAGSEHAGHNFVGTSAHFARRVWSRAIVIFPEARISAAGWFFLGSVRFTPRRARAW